MLTTSINDGRKENCICHMIMYEIVLVNIALKKILKEKNNYIISIVHINS